MTDVFAALAVRLELVDPTPQPALAYVYADPAEAVSLADFPVGILTLAPQQAHTWREEAFGLGRHDYTVAIYIFIGIRSTGLAELHSRVLAWPKPIADVLIADLTLGGLVHSIGAGESDALFTYSIGEFQWSDGSYFGLKILLPVTEKAPQLMG